MPERSRSVPKGIRAALGLVLAAGVFAASFLLGHALAESDRGEVGEPQSFDSDVTSPRIVAFRGAPRLPRLMRDKAPPEGGGGGGGGEGGGGDGGDGGGGGGNGGGSNGDQKPPVAYFTAPESALVDERVELDAQMSYDSEGEQLRYEWSLHGSDFETGEVVQFATYQSAGPVDITLRVRDEDGLTDQLTRTITIKDKPAPAGSE